MTLARTFDTIKWLDISEQEELISAALEETYPDIQQYAVSTLFDDKLADISKILFNYFPRLSEEAKKFLLGRRWNLITLARNVLKQADDNSRIATMDVLNTIGGPDVCGALTSVLGDSSQRITTKSLDILEEIFKRFLLHYSAAKTNPASKTFVEDNKGIIIETMKALLDNFDRHKRPIFAKALVELGIQAYPTLVKHILAPGNSSLYKMIRQLIMETDSEAVVETLFKLSNERDEQLTTFADDILTAKQGSARFPILVANYLDRLNPEIFNATAARTKKIQWLEAIFIAKDLDGMQSEKLVSFVVRSGLPEADKYKILFRLFKSASPYLAIQSFEGLKFLKCPYLEDALEEAYKVSPFESVRMMAADIIIKTSPQKKVELFSQFVNSTDEDIRRKAYATLGEETFVRLTASLDKLDDDMQRKAAQALAKLGPSIGDKLSKEIDSLDPQKRIRALKIAGLAGGDLIKIATAFINDPDVKVRATAVKALGAAPTGEGLRLLVNLLKDPDRRIRGNAVESIEDIGDKRLAPLLEPLVNDADNRVRGNAIKALWVLGKKDIAGAVENMLIDEEENMRLSGVWVAGETKYQGAKEDLVNMLSTESSTKVKDKILEVLKGKIA